MLTAFSQGQIPPSDGFNALKDSILVKRVWGEVMTPLGLLRFGRMGSQWGLGLLAAFCTAFYMFRLMGMTFYGKSRVDPEVEPRIHESPPSMVGPLVLLAIPTTFLGLLIGTGLFVNDGGKVAFDPGGPVLGISPIKKWLEPVFHPGEVILGITFPEYEFFGLNGGLLIISVAMDESVGLPSPMTQSSTSDDRPPVISLGSTD